MKIPRQGKGLLRVGVTGKLLGIVLPLVVLPCLVTGWLGYIASEGIVTRLLNQSQINLAREIAEQINQDFVTCEADLKLISRLPVLTDYYYNRFYELESEAEINRKQAEEFFKDLARKSSLYYRVSYLDSNAKEVACVEEGDIVSPSYGLRGLPFKTEKMRLSSDKPLVSPVTKDTASGRLVVHMGQALFDRWNEFAGMVIIDLDIGELGRRILSRRVGDEGYAFVLDSKGMTVVHPESRHLGLLPGELGLPDVEKLIGIMMREEQGMASYGYQGKKIAAYTRVEDRGWIIAVTLPVAEFKAHVMVIKKQVFHIVLLAASLALAAGVFFSWHFLRPIKTLARATNVITEGRLPRKLEFESGDELGVLTHSFNQMVQNLRRVQAELVKSEKLVSLGRLAAGVAHEIRNPLHTMKVSIDMLQRKIADQPQAREFADMISEEVFRLDHFVSDFLSYARQPPPKPTPTDINEMLNEIATGHSGLAAEKGVVIEKKLDKSLPLFPLDPFQIERALVNIVVNALEAMPEGGRLTLSTRLVVPSDKQDSAPELEIRVTDTGMGMDQETLQNAFDPFYTTKELGTGLGLPFTQSIVEGHWGRIQITSEVGKGTSFVITLPQELKVSQGEAGDESL